MQNGFVFRCNFQGFQVKLHRNFEQLIPLLPKIIKFDKKNLGIENSSIITFSSQKV